MKTRIKSRKQSKNPIAIVDLDAEVKRVVGIISPEHLEASTNRIKSTIVWPADWAEDQGYPAK